MRATIVVEENRVRVDGGMPRTVDCSALVGIHAVQWYDTYGEVERKPTGFDDEIKLPIQPPNEHITDLSPYQIYIDAYLVEDAKQKAIEKANEDALKAFIEAGSQ